MHTQPGDGVIINPPAYPPYFDDIAHVGPAGRRGAAAARTSASTSTGWTAAFGAGAKALLLCSPHNPSGRVYSREELAAVAAVAEAHGALVVVDEIHAPLTFGGAVHAVADTCRRAARCSPRRRRRSTCRGSSSGFVVGEPATALHARPALPRGLRGRDRGRGGLPRRRRVAGRDDRDDRGQPAVAAGPASRGREAAHRADASYLAWLACDFDDPAARFLERGRVALQSGPGFGAAYNRYARLNVGTTPELVREAVRRMASALD